jgi:hypothetical protein
MNPEEAPESTFLLTDSAPSEAERVEEAEEAPDPEEILTVARQVARVGGETWREGEGLDSLVTLATAAERAECDVATLREAIAKEELLAFEDHAGETLVPAFQLALEAEAFGPVVAEVNGLLGPVCADKRTIWMWFLSAKEELAGESPAQALAKGGPSEPIILAASRDAKRLGA